MNTESLSPAQKIRLRILAEVRPTDTDVKACVWRALQNSITEARSLGWPESTIGGMRIAYARIGAEVIAEATERVARRTA